MTASAQLLDEAEALEDGDDAATFVERPPSRSQRLVTAAILFGPFVGVAVAIVWLFGRGVTVLDLVLAVVSYVLVGHGVTAGYHRMLTHRSFVATRGTKIALVLAGSLAFEGGAICWVANHRCHHAYTDVEGDPHSPYLVAPGAWARTKGVFHAHMGWFFTKKSCDVNRWAPDLVIDRDLVIIDRLFPVMCVLSLGVPALTGWAITGTAAGALGGFIWGGLVRVFVLQHATFAVNSACHIWGTRPFKTRRTDRASNFAPLAVLSLGENWHNLHHSNPTYARHGVDRGQLDSTTRLIRVLELTGRVSQVRWPTRDTLAARRVATSNSAKGELPISESTRSL